MGGYSYDVFVSHSAADRDWAADWLVPRLEAAGLTVALAERDFLPGASRLDAIEQVVAASRHALIIVTPAWTADEWNAYEARLTHAFDPNARHRKLIPVRLQPCTPPNCLLPRAIADLVMADFTAPQRWDAELARLLRALRPIVPPPPRPTVEQRLSRRQWWGWWLSYRRRRVMLAGLFAPLVLLLACALLGWPTFTGWQALGQAIPQAWRLYRAGDVLLVSTATDAAGCALVGQALWRSADGGASWQTVNAPLRAPAAGQTCVAAAIVDFSHAVGAPQTIYAATTNAGLLRSTDAGLTWARVGQAPLPDELTRVAVAPGDVQRVWAAGARGGLFGSTDGGASWTRLDGNGVCTDGATPLPAAFVAGSLLATADALYVGSWLDVSKPGIYPGAEAGLYVSHDGGACWTLADSAEERYGYADLKEVVGRPGQLLALVRSYQETESSYPYELWLFVAGQGRVRRVWASCHAAAGLLAGPEPQRWSVATAVGDVTTGTVETSAAGEAAPCRSLFATLTGRDRVGGQPLPTVRRCALPPLCFSDLAADDRSAAPLLLVGERVYRLAHVPWPQALWP